MSSHGGPDRTIAGRGEGFDPETDAIDRSWGPKRRSSSA